ncbi:MAG: FMN-binding negative transcriptional regulator [Aestuariibacter sp.]
MYVPKNMQLQDRAEITQFIAEFGFALMVSPDMQASHLPLIYQADEGPNGTLYGHMARANPQWRELSGADVLCVFSGPHSYISPTWYAAGPAVPTWNYAAVHCYGSVSLLDEQQTTVSMDWLVQKYEPELLNNQGVMPADYRQKLVKAVVGFKIAVSDIQAKEKLGQQRKSEDQQGVVQGLSESEFDDAQALLAYMRKRNLGLGKA